MGFAFIFRYSLSALVFHCPFLDALGRLRRHGISGTTDRAAIPQVGRPSPKLIFPHRCPDPRASRPEVSRLLVR
jgi:hypothetical protein